MAAREETLRFKVEASGSPAIKALAQAVDDLGKAGELTKEEFEGVSSELGKLIDEANQARGLKEASERFKVLARSVLELQQRIDASKSKVAGLGKALSEATEPTRKQTQEFERARAELARLESAQERQRAKLRDLKSGFDAAGLSTRNLVAAERELQARISATEAAMAGVVANARNAAAARQQAVQSERALIDALRASAAQQQRAQQATANLQRARDILAARSQSAVAGERAYAQTLGTSAAKIAAIGAAALGINSAVGLARSALSQLIDTAGQFQTLDVQLGAVFKDQADEASEAIRALAQQTPFQLTQIQESFVKLKAFGLDPLDGSFEAIADQAAKLGGQQETLTGITLALGQAWAKQKLQGEEILQLVERGVPVWELLQRATGKNVQELQKLSEAGKLGRAEIKLLIEEIGKSAEGAGQAVAGTLPKQIDRLRAQWQEFLDLVADSGVLDYLQDQLASVSKTVKDMAASGELQEWAQEVSDAIVEAAETIKGTVAFLVEHREAILALGQAYVASKIGSSAASLLGIFAKLGPTITQTTAAMNSAKFSTTGLLGPLGALATAGSFLIGSVVDLTQAVGELDSAHKRLAGSQDEAAGETALLAQRAKELQEQYAQFADVAVASSQQLAAKSREGLQEYIAQLKGAIDYQRGLGKEAIAAGDNIGRIAALAKLEDLRAGLDAARDRLEALHEAAVRAFAKVGEAGAKASATYDELIAKGNSAVEAVAKLFDGLNFADPTSLPKVIEVLDQVSIRGTDAASAIRDELLKSLTDLDAQSLGRFQANVADALAKGSANGKELSALLGQTLQAALAKLGVTAAQSGAQFTRAGSEMVRAFRVVADNGQATAEQIETAFEAALGSVETLAEIDALGAALKEAMSAGRIGAEAAELAMRKLQDRMAAVRAQADPLADSFSALGIRSKAALDAAAAAARTAFDSIVQGARQGKAAQEDVVAAFEAYAQAQRAAVVNSSEAAKVQLERQLQLQAAAAGIAAHFEAAGAAGQAAGDRVAAAFENARSEVEGATDAVRQLASDTDEVADSSDRAATSVQAVGAAYEGALLLSAEQKTALKEINQEIFRMGDLQSLSLDRAKQLLQSLGNLSIAQADALRQRINELQAVADRAQQVADNMAREADALQDQIDQLRGNEADVEERRHERRLEELRAEAEAAGQLNTAEYNRVVQLEKELHELRTNNLREQERQRRAAEAAAARAQDEADRRARDAEPTADERREESQPRDAKRDVNVTFNGKDLGRVDTTNAAELQRLSKALLPHIIDEIKRAARATGAFGR